MDLPMAKKKNQIGYRILKIHTIKFSFEDINEDHLLSLLKDPNGLGIDLNISLNIKKENSTITVDISSQLYNNKDRSLLVDHVGRTIFHVNFLESTYNKAKDAFDLPDNLVIHLYTISYTHARALLATEASPTIYKDRYFLPIIDPSQLLPKNKKSDKIGG
jgi:hypothetical protein